MVGKTLGHYEIVEPLGAGGMGEVYRARDTKLDRDVAIKVLPADLAADQERLARLEREAKLLAALNHPNIASIYGLEEMEGTRFLVLELVDGDSLDRRIAGGPLPIASSLDICRQIAEALEAAHAAGIIHRDLKPANVLVTPDGRAKVLDFGIAKSVDVGSRVHETAKETNLTLEGTLVGTPAYMSPEQVRGEVIDERADIWALGCLLYETLAGTSPFARETLADTLAAIVDQEPDWRRLPKATPESVRALLRRCLRKETNRRVHHMTDARIEIDDARYEREGDQSVRGGRRVLYAGVTVLVAAALLIGYLARGLVSPSPPEVWNGRQITRLQSIESQPSLSPDGQFIVYTSNQRGNLDIYWQLVDGQNAQNLTESSEGDDYQPAFSPAGDRIAFRSDRGNGGLYIMGAFGENPRLLIDRGYDPTWSPDGQWIVFSDLSIVDPTNLILGGLAMVEVADPTNVVELHDRGYLPAFSPNGHRIAYFDTIGDVQRDILTIPADGGEPVQVTNDAALDWAPAWAPDGRRLYFSSDRGGAQNIWWIEIDEVSGVPRGTPQRVGVSEVDQGWLSVSADGRSIAYTARREPMNLQRIAFDSETRRVVGTPQWVTSGTNSVIRFDVSPDGESLAYSSQAPPVEIFLISADGSGEPRQLTEDEHVDEGPRFSPDGRQIVYSSARGGLFELWSMDLESGISKQLTQVGVGSVADPVFSPSGSKLMYRVTTTDGYFNYIMSMDQEWAAQEPETFTNPEGDTFQPSYWSPDGRRIVGWSDAFTDPRLLLLDPETREYEELGDFRGHAHPAWLGDDYLVFVGTAETRGVATRREQMLLMDRRNGETELLLNDGPDWTFEEQMVVSPDGRWLYFIRLELESDVWLLTRER